MRSLRALSTMALAIMPFGCVSLLGDYSQGSGPAEGGTGEGGTSDGTTDGQPDGPSSTDGAHPPDGGPSGDAPVDQDGASLQLLTCNVWQNSSPLTLLQIPAPDSGGNQNPPIRRINVEHLASGNARVVVSVNGASETDTIVFTVSEQNGSGTPQSLTLPFTGLQGEAKTASATVLLLQEYMASTLSYYAIDDTDPGSDAAAESPLATIGNPPSQGMGQFNTGFLPMTGNQYFTLAAYQTTTSSYDLASWLAPTQTAWALPLQNQAMSIGSQLVAGASGVYGFFAPIGTGNGNGPTTLQQITFDPMGAMAPTGRTITATGETGAALAVGQTPSGQYQLAFVTLTGAQMGGLHAGLVDASQINSFMINSLPSLGFKPGGDAGFFDTTPFGGGQGGPGGRWLSNGDFAIMGTGGTGGSGNMYTGLNFYVGTTSGQWVVETAGTGQNVLPGHAVQAFGFDLQQAVNDILLAFDVAWTEQLTDGSTALYFNQLKCQL